MFKLGYDTYEGKDSTGPVLDGLRHLPNAPLRSLVLKLDKAADQAIAAGQRHGS